MRRLAILRQAWYYKGVPYRRMDLAVYILITLFLVGAGTVWWGTVRPRPVVLRSQTDPALAAGGAPAVAGGGREPPDTADRTGTAGEDPEKPPQIVVHVAGAVERPGVYALTEGQRVHEAVQMAGGAREDAALDWVNLARLLVDGERIYIPSRNEVSGGAGGTALDVLQISGTPNPGLARFPVNVNTADASLLDTIPGIGPSIAQAIIRYRTENGPFGSVDDLLEVTGIGPKTLSKIAPYVTVR